MTASFSLRLPTTTQAPLLAALAGLINYYGVLVFPYLFIENRSIMTIINFSKAASERKSIKVDRKENLTFLTSKVRNLFTVETLSGDVLGVSLNKYELSQFSFQEISRTFEKNQFLLSKASCRKGDRLHYIVTIQDSEITFGIEITRESYEFLAGRPELQEYLRK